MFNSLIPRAKDGRQAINIGSMKTPYIRTTFDDDLDSNINIQLVVLIYFINVGYKKNPYILATSDDDLPFFLARL